MANSKTAWIAGATGLVGSSLLNELLAAPEYERVVSIARRASGRVNPKLVEKITEFRELYVDDLPAPDDVFCALGTTIKKAGSQAKFREVDLVYPLKLGERAKAMGARRFLLVSSVGASENSTNFYLRTKGEVESAIIGLQFEATHIFRPSMLLGARRENRPGERIAAPITRVLTPLMIGVLQKYRPIHSIDVAHAMVSAAQNNTAGLQIYEYSGIRNLAAH